MDVENLNLNDNSNNDQEDEISSSVIIPDQPVFLYKSTYTILDQEKVYQFNIKRGVNQQDHLVTAIRPLGRQFWYFIENKNSRKLKKHAKLIQEIIKNEIPIVPKKGRVLDIYLSTNYLKLYYNDRLDKHIFDGFLLIDEKLQIKSSIDAFGRQLVGRAKAVETRKKTREIILKNKISLTRDSDSEDPDLADNFDYEKYLDPKKFTVKPSNTKKSQNESSTSGDSSSNKNNEKDGEDNLQNKDEEELIDHSKSQEEDGEGEEFSKNKDLKTAIGNGNNNLFSRHPSIDTTKKSKNDYIQKINQSKHHFFTPQNSKLNNPNVPNVSSSTGKKRSIDETIDNNCDYSFIESNAQKRTNLTEDFNINFNLEDSITSSNQNNTNEVD